MNAFAAATSGSSLDPPGSLEAMFTLRLHTANGGIAVDEAEPVRV
jgi:hypothetical protein